MALRDGILLLLVVPPFGVFGTVATLVIRSQRRRKEDADPEGGAYVGRP